MKIIGDKIIIRDLTFKDSDLYYEFGKNPNVGPMAGWKPFTSKEVANRMLSSLMLSGETFCIADKNTNEFLGTISIYNGGIRKYKFVKTLGFSLREDKWGQGIMTQAAKLCINYIFTRTDCEVIEVGHHSDNYQSKRVIEKCGFNYDGRLCMYKKLYDGRIVDADFYSMTKNEFERKRFYEGIKTKI